MPSWDFATGTVVLPAWAVGAALSLLVCVGGLTFARGGAYLAAMLLRVAAVVAAFSAAWFWFNQMSLTERAAERRALDARISDLNLRVLAPGSVLACLDAAAGEAVESACEKAVFATPQSVAAAVSYVSARLALLADATDFARRTGSLDESGIAPLRLAIEADRFGLVAHVLSVRNSCTPLVCDSYVLLHDPDRVQANLRERLFDRYVERYAPKWAAQAPLPSMPVADASAGSNAPPSASAPATPLPSKYDFPSAASIPAVSIMNAEPGAASEPKSDAKADAKPDANAPSGPAHHTAQHPAPTRAPAARPTPAPPQSKTPATAPGAALH